MSEAGRATRRVHVCAGLILVGLLVLAFMSARFAKPVTAQEPQTAGDHTQHSGDSAGFAYRQTNFISDIRVLLGSGSATGKSVGISATASSPSGSPTMVRVRRNSSATRTVRVRRPQPEPTDDNYPGVFPTGTVSNRSLIFS